MNRSPTRPRADDPFSRGGTRPAGQVLDAKRRVAHLAADGRAAAEIAAIEDVEPGQVDELLADARFASLVRAYKALDARPSAEQRAKLVAIALHLIDEAIGLGHVRVGFFVVREMLHGRCAAETVADKLIAQRAKAAEPPPPPVEPPSEPAKPHLPAHPADRMAQRAQSQLMLALLGENRVREEGRARAVRRELDAAKARRLAGGLPPHLAERHDRLVEALRAAAAPEEPAADDAPAGPRLSQAP